MTSRRPPPSRFQRLALTHAAMMGGEASMVVALADSFFFDVDPNGARGRVLLFLLVSFAPFLLVAPLIGPVIDRMRGGRRLVIMLVAGTRIVLQVLMIRYSDTLALFPLVFGALVLQKTYTVSKSALVPSVVRSERELVEANSKLGLIAGLTGFVAVVPAGLLQVVLGTPATLAYGAALFAVALVAATRLPSDVGVVSPGTRDGRRPPLPHDLRVASTAMMLLRCCVGFLLFHLAFWFRTEDAGTLWFGVAVGLSSVATMIGNAIGPRIRGHISEEHMMLGALVIPAIAAVGATLLGGKVAAIGLAVVLNFCAAVARLAFESIVQRDAPGANRGETFARVETKFQLGWVAAATVPVLLEIPGALGLLLVGVLAAIAAVGYRSGLAGGAGSPARGVGVSRR